MGLFGMFKKKKPPEKQVYEIGQVGTNPNQKLVRKDDGKLFIQEKGFMGSMREVPIHDGKEKKDMKTGEIKKDEN